MKIFTETPTRLLAALKVSWQAFSKEWKEQQRAAREQERAARADYERYKTWR